MELEQSSLAGRRSRTRARPIARPRSSRRRARSAAEEAALSHAATQIQRQFRAGRERERAVRLALERAARATPHTFAAACASRSLDALGAVVRGALGHDAWVRAFHNAPEEWEEGDMAAAVSSALADPLRAAEVWLLARPTKYERALLDLRTHGAAAATRPAPPRTALHEGADAADESFGAAGARFSGPTSGVSGAGWAAELSEGEVPTVPAATHPTSQAHDAVPGFTVPLLPERSLHPAPDLHPAPEYTSTYELSEGEIPPPWWRAGRA